MPLTRTDVVAELPRVWHDGNPAIRAHGLEHVGEQVGDFPSGLEGLATITDEKRNEIKKLVLDVLAELMGELSVAFSRSSIK